MTRISPGLVALLMLACVGCDGTFGGGPMADAVKPTVAVMKFDNRVAFPVNWSLGTGMRDVLTDRLVATGRFRVIERPEIEYVLKEQQFQNSGLTRPQQKARVGQLKNVQYLVKGTITDFGHVHTGDGFLGMEKLNVFHTGSKAVMGMTLYVVDVESGEVICSESLEEAVRASDTKVEALYKGVGFGGRLFYTKPLGRATARVIDRAVGRVGRVIAGRPWQAKVALVQAGGAVVINGGRNRGLRAGETFRVLEQGKPIVDPDTGDVLGEQPGTLIGTVRIDEVRPKYSVAKIVQGKAGDFAVGQHCRAVRETEGK